MHHICIPLVCNRCISYAYTTIAQRHGIAYLGSRPTYGCTHNCRLGTAYNVSLVCSCPIWLICSWYVDWCVADLLIAMQLVYVDWCAAVMLWLICSWCMLIDVQLLCLIDMQLPCYDCGAAAPCWLLCSCYVLIDMQLPCYDCNAAASCWLICSCYVLIEVQLFSTIEVQLNAYDWSAAAFCWLLCSC